MWELITKLDNSIFFLINRTLSNDFFDIIFPYITEKKNWFLPIFFVVLLLITRGEKKGRLFVILCLISIFFTDQLTSNFLKDIIIRPRPFLTLAYARQLIDSANNSFPSSHAANIFGIAILARIYYPEFKFFYWIAAFLVGYSRIYVGVHYPSDVIAGMIIGVTIGYVLYKGSLKFNLFSSFFH